MMLADGTLRIYSRLYAAKGANQQISKLVRIWDVPVEIGNYAVLDGQDQYRIDAIQPAKDDEGLKVVDLTLVREENHYEVLAE